MNSLILLAAFAVWALVHSWAASLGAKDLFRRRFGANFMRLHRLGYNLFSVITLLPVAWLTFRLPDRILYIVPAPWSYILFAGQAAAGLLLLITLLQTDALAFIGLRQLMPAAPQPGTFVRDGSYRLVRHPLYAYGLLLLWLTPAMSVNTLTMYSAFTLYIIIGASFEERKLLREFGAAYAQYRADTPMLIPGLRFKRNK